MPASAADIVPAASFDAFLLASFGGPEAENDVLPFLENVLRGRNVPRARRLAVAGHYSEFGGRSPLNRANRRLLSALDADFRAHGMALPCYWGNRNWHPFLSATVRRMRADGVRRALVLVTSAFGSYSGCRQYQENLAFARAAAGDGAPELVKLRLFYNHPGFIAAAARAIRAALPSAVIAGSSLPVSIGAASSLPVFVGANSGISAAAPSHLHLLFTAHGIPLAMARVSPYEAQLQAACRLVVDALQKGGVRFAGWSLAWQSRSGPPSESWLEPALEAELRRLALAQPGAAVVVSPLGFLSDHMEVVYDLDHEARRLAASLGLGWSRAAAIAEQPEFVATVRQLVAERLDPEAPRLALGPAPADPCAPDCCLIASHVAT